MSSEIAHHTSAAAAAPGRTLPTELARGPALHCLVRIELTNGTVLTGRITDMDPEKMNMKVDAITYAAVKRQEASSSSKDGIHAKKEKKGDAEEGGATVAAVGAGTLWREEVRPVALRCVNSVAVRGACVRYLDFISEESTGGRGLGDITVVAGLVRPS